MYGAEKGNLPKLIENSQKLHYIRLERVKSFIELTKVIDSLLNITVKGNISSIPVNLPIVKGREIQDNRNTSKTK